MSDQNASRLREAFVGREFVFRADWHQGMMVYQGEPVNNWSATFYNQTEMVKRDKHKLGVLIASGGEVATITTVEPVYSYRLYLGFKTESGKSGYLIICSQNNNSWGTEFYQEMTDELVTVPWVEKQLTNRTIRFFSDDERKASAAVKAISAPTEQLQLTAPPSARRAIAAVPAIVDLRVEATPNYVRPGGSVSLSLAYQIGPSEQQTIEVSEVRYLTFEGKNIPHYPKRQSKSLSAGDHHSNYRQVVPPGAKPGLYSYRGEVCIQNNCSSQSVAFTVGP